MTGKGLWAELEFMEGAECKKMLKGEQLTHILWMIDVNPCSAQPKEYSGTAGEWTEHRQFLPSIEFCAAKVFYSYLFFGLVYAMVFLYQVLGLVVRQPGCPLDTVNSMI